MAKKTMKKKTTSSKSKPESFRVKKGYSKIACKVLLDDEKRDSILVEVDGVDLWLLRDKIDKMVEGSDKLTYVSIPKWYKELKDKSISKTVKRV